MTSKTSQQANKNHFYEELKQKILTMDLEPGVDLDEVGLSELYGLSRTPVRDVFRRMAGEGYVEIIGNKGASVASMNHKTLKEFVQTAPLIYVSVTRLAVNNATPAQLKELKRVQTKYRNAVKKEMIDDLVIFDNEFHTMLGEMADNHYLAVSLQRLLIDHARISHSYFDRTAFNECDSLENTVVQHDKLIDAIDNGREETAVAITLEHWDISKHQSDRFVNPDPIPLELIAV